MSKEFNIRTKSATKQQGDEINGKIGETTDNALDYTLLGYNSSLY